VLRFTGDEPEDERDTTFPSTLLCPVAITSPNAPYAPARKFFGGEWASLKTWFLFTIEKIGAFASKKGFAFPFPSYYGVSVAVYTFYKTLGFRFTMEVFQQEED